MRDRGSKTGVGCFGVVHGWVGGNRGGVYLGEFSLPRQDGMIWGFCLWLVVVLFGDAMQ